MRSYVKEKPLRNDKFSKIKNLGKFGFLSVLGYLNKNDFIKRGKQYEPLVNADIDNANIGLAKKWIHVTYQAP